MEQYLVRAAGSDTPSPFFGGQSVDEESIRDRVAPYSFGTTREPIEFTIEISPVDKEWTPQRKSEIGRWLIHDEYKEFQTASDMGKIYYAIVTEASEFTLHSNNIGYIPITFRTNSPYAWSPIYIDRFDLSENDGKQIIEIDNLSNINKNYKPKIEIELADYETDVTLRNLSNKGEVFKFEGLFDNEIVSVDNENEIMVSNRALSNPFSKFNGNFLELVYGVNQIEVTGKVIIGIKCQFPIL